MYPKLTWVIFHLEYAQLWNWTHSNKANIRLSLLFHAKFYWLKFVVVWGFWERRFFLITGYEFLVAFPHQEIHNPKFAHLEIILVSFSIAI
jgi:hypothetical protein